MNSLLLDYEYQKVDIELLQPRWHRPRNGRGCAHLDLNSAFRHILTLIKRTIPRFSLEGAVVGVEGDRGIELIHVHTQTWTRMVLPMAQLTTHVCGKRGFVFMRKLSILDVIHISVFKLHVS